MDWIEKVCDCVEEERIDASHVRSLEDDEILKVCAQPVCEKWLNIDKKDWSQYVVLVERHLMDCSACKTVQIRQCHREHQKTTCELHKLTCGKNKK